MMAFSSTSLDFLPAIRSISLLYIYLPLTIERLLFGVLRKQWILGLHFKTLRLSDYINLVKKLLSYEVKIVIL